MRTRGDPAFTLPAADQAPPLVTPSQLFSPRAMSNHKNQKPPQKLRRNERERKRVHQVNQGFNTLRERVPRPPGSKHKLSKVETLREAAKYIAQLRSILGDDFQSIPSIQSSPSYYQPAPNGGYYHQPGVSYQTEISPCASYYSSSDSSFDEPHQQKFFAH